MTAPTHSVVVPVRNGARYVGESLASILAELGADDELIVVDNGSTDDTVARIETIGDDRIVLLHQPVPGPAAALCAVAIFFTSAWLMQSTHVGYWMIKVALALSGNTHPFEWDRCG